MIKAVVIDDEPLARTIVKEYLTHHPGLEVVAECSDGFQGVKAITEHKPGVVFLDVQMPKISGLEMLELLDEIPPVIFTTAFEEYAIKAFEANAVDYLLKPFSQDRFNEAIHRFQARTPQTSEVERLVATQPTNRIVLRDAGKIKIIAIKDLHYMEADDDYVKLHTTEGTFMRKITLTHYENRLPSEQFVRVHRSYLVNVAQITGIEPYEKTSHIAKLKTGEKLQVSKAGYQRLKEVLGI